MTRRTRLGLVAALVTVLLPLLAPPATAAGVPYASLSCGSGWVQTTAPHVLAQQGARGAAGPDAFWIAELWGWTGSTWVHVQWSQWWLSPVRTTDFNPGALTGYAGPSWYPYGVVNGSWTQSVWFRVAPGYHYAIRNWVHDGSWSSAWAATAVGFSCRA